MIPVVAIQRALTERRGGGAKIKYTILLVFRPAKCCAFQMVIQVNQYVALVVFRHIILVNAHSI